MIAYSSSLSIYNIYLPIPIVNDYPQASVFDCFDASVYSSQHELYWLLLFVRMPASCTHDKHQFDIHSRIFDSNITHEHSTSKGQYLPFYGISHFIKKK